MGLIPMASRRTIAFVVAAILAAAGGAEAQYARGVVRDSATGEPVAGAVVVLNDTAGKFMARTLADASGRFALIRSRGATSLHLVRIGYKPLDFALGASAPDSVLDIRMHQIAAALTAVTASGRRVCPGETGDMRALELWEQARAALLASVVTRETQPPRIRMHSFKRTFEPIRKRLVADTSSYKEMVVDRSFVAGRPAWAFASQGYMREHLGGEREYFAPDEEVLLDPSFAATHCLRLVSGKGDHAAHVGIGFDPIDDAERDTLVDVSGTLWLARTNPTLQALEFQYTNLERRADGSGGEIQFAQMPNGVPLIQRWTIHTMILAIDLERMPNGNYRRPPPRPHRTDVRILGYRESGGVVGFATWPDGREWNSGLPRIRGTVVDDSGRGVPRIAVWFFGSNDTVRTGADGQFTLPFVFPGLYYVLASDSLLATEGIARTVTTSVYLSKPEERVIELRLHPRSAVLPLVCPAKSYKPGTGVLLSRVVDSTGQPAARAKIEVAARQAFVAGDTVQRVLTQTGEAGADGRFVICGAALDQPIAVRATKNGETATVLLDKWTDDVVVLTLALKRGG
jgi:hypothetical protein